MNTAIWVGVIRGGSALVAMVLIWRLVETALLAGINGVVFFTGVAAIAGLGGYSIRWVLDLIKAESEKRGKGK